WCVHGRAPRRVLWPLHDEDNDREGNESWNDGNPEHGSKIICQRRHKDNRCEWTEHGADRIERLTQAEGVAAQLGGREICDQGVARRATDALAYPVNETRRCQPSDARSQRKDRFGKSGKAVAERRQELAFAEKVA